MKRSKLPFRLALSGMMCALSFVFLLFGAITDVLDLSMLIFTSVCLVIVVVELGQKQAWLVWLVTAVLAVLFLPSKSAALLYLLGGMYPILKAISERLPRWWGWVLKFVLFNIFQCLFLLAAQKLLGLPADEYSLALPILAIDNVLFLLYDFALSVFVVFYLRRLRRVLRFDRYR